MIVLCVCIMDVHVTDATDQFIHRGANVWFAFLVLFISFGLPASHCEAAPAGNLLCRSCFALSATGAVARNHPGGGMKTMW